MKMMTQFYESAACTFALPSVSNCTLDAKADAQGHPPRWTAANQDSLTAHEVYAVQHLACFQG